VDFELKNALNLTGELWNSRVPGDDLDICLRPAETANGLRRMNAMSAEVAWSNT
jgi:hypothetical protein